MKKIIDLRYNTDGTVTAIFGTGRASFKVEDWMTKEDVYDRAKWELISLGVPIDYTDEEELNAKA
jgi:hypothetical protein